MGFDLLGGIDVDAPTDHPTDTTGQGLLRVPGRLGAIAYNVATFPLRASAQLGVTLATPGPQPHSRPKGATASFPSSLPLPGQQLTLGGPTFNQPASSILHPLIRSNAMPIMGQQIGPSSGTLNSDATSPAFGAPTGAILSNPNKIPTNAELQALIAAQNLAVGVPVQPAPSLYYQGPDTNTPPRVIVPPVQTSTGPMGFIPQVPLAAKTVNRDDIC